MQHPSKVIRAKELHQNISNFLIENGKTDFQEVKLLAYYLMEFLYKISRTDVLRNQEVKYLEKELEACLLRLLADEPIQYITQKAYFYGLELSVNEHTLIPRPETEELVEWIVRQEQGAKNLRILDIGTGSGCIPVALAKQLPDNEYFAIDISSEALTVAQTNARKNNVRISFFCQDILNKSLEFFFPLHIIVSNPPYICLNEKENMNYNVVGYEPASALFVPDTQPLLFYERIATVAQEVLVEGGRLYFEINQQYGEEIREMLKQKQYRRVEIGTDLSKNQRFAIATK